MTESLNKDSSRVSSDYISNELIKLETTDEIDLRELVAVIWHGKWVVILCSIICAISGGIYAYIQPDIYESDVLLTAASTDSNYQLASMPNQLSGIASLAGINIGNGSGTQKVLYALQVLQSRKFISNFIREHDLLVPLMATEGWDKKTEEFSYQKDIYNITDREWVHKNGISLKPSLLVATNYFIKKVMQVNIDTKNHMMTVSLNFFSPYSAQQWLNWLIEDLNDEIRHQDMIDAQNSIDYLENQVTKTSLADSRTMLYQLMEQQTKKLMLTKIHKEYILKTVDPAVIAERPDKPKRKLIVIISMCLGAFFGIVTVLMRRIILTS
ncbi:Wzz/FepE/Etk N-terminal domain-containing protein [Vibrio gazogenes]|uniref:LPS O-antigen chain length determinant protein, WzzB/FepE family n=1 Tax=Vibrio gazogenes DSM 21264 = NBRC 103151 TaxID=1123492 RepID=A0A1M5D136_VIBGA|nr:Wzz/FepE/Etk N-terminal domain-containing protein [Vibrio gazogenes]USP13915.1 Wzz/FepE/Etk N-terminal domain-containing protein [Vibrio gazogenes]SHF60718.1 LPS O-antigen chain length determinant protein, WzzB/FepE family [Vibrio gazogenes DSM 21264] [Vibrio gazogenes DSM 21264 = NBRC 103151]SJN56648.1 tyrosine kinase [Vibrio gazogenes]